MVGRTPEYLGKKIGAREVKFSALAILIPFPAPRVGRRRVGDPAGTDRGPNQGPHGFSEILYAWLSMGNNNGSAFAGSTVTDSFYSVGGGLVMLASRFVRSSPRWRSPAVSAARERFPRPPGPCAPDTLCSRTPYLRRRHHRRADVPAGAHYRADSRAALEQRESVLMPSHHAQDRDDRTRPTRAPTARSAHRQAGARRERAQAQPRTLIKNPVIFVVEVVSVMLTIDADIVRSGGRASATPSISLRGCGSRSCSPTSPRRWQRDVAKRRRTRCGERKPTRTEPGCCPTGTQSRFRLHRSARVTSFSSVLAG